MLSSFKSVAELSFLITQEVMSLLQPDHHMKYLTYQEYCDNGNIMDIYRVMKWHKRRKNFLF